MKADSRHELIARIHADYVNVLLLDFKPILSVKK